MQRCCLRSSHLLSSHALGKAIALASRGSWLAARILRKYVVDTELLPALSHEDVHLWCMLVHGLHFGNPEHVHSLWAAYWGRSLLYSPSTRKSPEAVGPWTGQWQHLKKMHDHAPCMHNATQADEPYQCKWSQIVTIACHCELASNGQLHAIFSQVAPLPLAFSIYI